VHCVGLISGVFSHEVSHLLFLQISDRIRLHHRLRLLLSWSPGDLLILEITLLQSLKPIQSDRVHVVR
jgi:hypothetical protein